MITVAAMPSDPVPIITASKLSMKANAVGRPKCQITIRALSSGSRHSRPAPGTGLDVQRGVVLVFLEALDQAVLFVDLAAAAPNQPVALATA